MYTYRTRRRVEFAETDMAGIIHFSSYFSYMEAAEHAALRALGTSVHFEDGGKRYGWPRVSATCEFLRPVRFEDELDVVVSLERLGTRSLTWSFDFEHQGQAVARGEISTVCCQLTKSGPRGAPIPGWLVDRLRAGEPPRGESTG